MIKSLVTKCHLVTNFLPWSLSRSFQGSGGNFYLLIVISPTTWLALVQAPLMVDWFYISANSHKKNLFLWEAKVKSNYLNISKILKYSKSKAQNSSQFSVWWWREWSSLFKCLLFRSPMYLIKSEPFDIWTDVYHLNTGLVWYSDPHCIPLLIFLML